jgi:hypothetical protein
MMFDGKEMRFIIEGGNFIGLDYQLYLKTSPYSLASYYNGGEILFPSKGDLFKVHKSWINTYIKELLLNREDTCVLVEKTGKTNLFLDENLDIIDSLNESSLKRVVRYISKYPFKYGGFSFSNYDRIQEITTYSCFQLRFGECYDDDWHGGTLGILLGPVKKKDFAVCFGNKKKYIS